MLYEVFDIDKINQTQDANFTDKKMTKLKVYPKVESQLNLNEESKSQVNSI